MADDGSEFPVVVRQAAQHAAEAGPLTASPFVIKRAIQSSRRAVEWLRGFHWRAVLEKRSLRPYESAARHYEAIALALSERLENASQADEEVRLIPLAEDKGATFERINAEINSVSQLVGVVSRAVYRQGEMIAAMEENINDASANVPAAERAIVRQFYPDGYREEGWCSRRLLWRLLIMLVLFVLLGVLVAAIAFFEDR